MRNKLSEYIYNTMGDMSEEPHLSEIKKIVLSESEELRLLRNIVHDYGLELKIYEKDILKAKQLISKYENK